MALMVKIRGVGLSARIRPLQTASGRALFCLLLLFVGASGAMAQERDVKPQDGQSGFGTIKFSGLLQAWYSSGDAGFDDTFRIRRAELKFTGEALRQLNWTVMVDPAKLLSQNTNVNRARGILQDGFITLSFHQRLNLNVGRFKVPLSLEGLQSSAGLDTERALFISDRARGGAYGDVRDIGVMAYGPLTDQLDYQIGFFDGSGDTRNELRNEQKAVAGRISYRPTFLPGLQVGTSSVRGNETTIERSRRDRLGADLLYLNGPVTLKTEYMTGKDGSLERKGYYAHFVYRLTPNVESILRYDTWDPDLSRESTAVSVTERDYIAGFNYFMHGSHVKLQFNYVRKTFEDDIVAPFNLAVLRLQTFW
ncbi:MAG: hypothetical protein EHM89_07685 [Acidobacteria bacterium]|jgi:phosphate-selective porin|nr:MAG: hypothetical protein EHM89_07685 [Acidobacteriota bacterium]